MLGIFKELDDKAGSIITYVGSGVGLLTLSSVAAITDPKIPRAVIFAALPAVLFSLAALVSALMARRTRAVYLPPCVKTATEYVAFFGDRAESAFIAHAHLCMSLMSPVMINKRWWVELAMIMSVVAVAFLIIPLATGLIVGPVALPIPPPIPAASP